VRGYNICELVKHLPDDASAYSFMERIRWGDTPKCAHCGSEAKHRFLTPQNGISRRTRTGNLSQRRIWKCRDCQRQFSVITNTPFHGSKVPLRTWILVIFEMCANTNGISAIDIASKYQLTDKAAWYVAHRINVALGTLQTPITKSPGQEVSDREIAPWLPKAGHLGSALLESSNYGLEI
jgi:transposase-like protein